MAAIYKFSEVERLMKAAGCLKDDGIAIARKMIENYSCRKCRASLEYKAYSDTSDTFEFGVCRHCGKARLFFRNSQVFAELARMVKVH
jgi:ribosomal protein L40E